MIGLFAQEATQAAAPRQSSATTAFAVLILILAMVGLSTVFRGGKSFMAKVKAHSDLRFAAKLAARSTSGAESDSRAAAHADGGRVVVNLGHGAGATPGDDNVVSRFVGSFEHDDEHHATLDGYEYFPLPGDDDDPFPDDDYLGSSYIAGVGRAQRRGSSRGPADHPRPAGNDRVPARLPRNDQVVGPVNDEW